MAISGEVVPELLDAVGADDDMVAPVIAAKRAEVESRAQRFREGRPAPRVSNRTVIVVDDGVANGVTARAALRSLRRAGAGRVILAVPVGSREGLAACVPYADEVVCPFVPPSLMSVGAHYRDFGQTSDDEVLRLLAAARQRQRSHVAERGAPR